MSIRYSDIDFNEPTPSFKIGDYVGFKSDIEQGGKIIAISGTRLTLSNPDGFEGGYIGGDTETSQEMRDCWID